MSSLNKLNLYFTIIFFLISLIFYLYPSLDIIAMRFFYDENIGFVYSKHWLIMLIFRSVPAITILYVFWNIVMAIKLYFSKGKNMKKIALHLTVLASIIIGPGIIINYGLKGNFGRARPKQIVEFGARKSFSSVYVLSNQCKTNCSFSSGHASAGFSFTSIAFFVPPQYQIVSYISTLIFGTTVGLGRMIQGGHFGSDVAVSGWVVLLINYILIAIYQRRACDDA